MNLTGDTFRRGLYRTKSLSAFRDHTGNIFRSLRPWSRPLSAPARGCDAPSLRDDDSRGTAKA